MHRAIFHVTLPILLWHLMSVVSQAQLVQVRPGYVKAPFVRVYRYPDGSSYVQAPFARVYSPAYRLDHSAQSVPAVADFAQMDWRLLSQAVREWSVRLDADLDHFPSGNNWKSHLKTAEIVALLPKQLDGPPAEDVRQQLQEILKLYSAPSNSNELSRIANLRSFQILQLALGEYAMTPEQRLRRQLFLAAHDLSRSLERFATGGVWQQYLMLALGMTLSEDKAQEIETAPNLADFARALARFDSVSQNSDYGVIAALPAFKTTRERLEVYLRQSETSSFNSPEELPAPKPDAQPSS